MRVRLRGTGGRNDLKFMMFFLFGGFVMIRL